MAKPFRAYLRGLGQRINRIPAAAAAPIPVTYPGARVTRAPGRIGQLVRGQVASASSAGGLPPIRPDQVQDPSSAGVAPGTASGTFRGRQVIVFGTGPGAGIFVYNGTPAAGNAPVLSIVAPGVTADPYGNTVGAVLTVGVFGGPGLNVDQFGNLSMAAADGSLLELSPQANLPFDLSATIGGVLQTVMAMQTNDPSEVQYGIVSGLLLGTGAAAKEATLITSPYASTGAGILLQAQNDGGTDTPWITFGEVVTAGALLTFIPLMALGPQVLLMYAASGGTTVITHTSGSGTISGLPATVKAEAWGAGASTAGVSGGASAVGGSGSGGYSAEPNLATLGSVTYSVPASANALGGSPPDCTIVGSAVTVTAHSGTGGTTAGSGAGALASGNTIATAGNRGGAPSFADPGGGGGGGGGSGPAGQGGNGHAGAPGAGGTGGSSPNGAPGGAGGSPTGNGHAGAAPGAGGGGGSTNASGAIGGAGQVRVTYTSAAPAIMASFAAAAGTDQFGTAYLEGNHFTDQVDLNTYSIGTIRQTTSSTPTIGSTTAANLAGISIPCGLGTYYYRAVVGFNEVAANAAFVVLGSAGVAGTVQGIVAYLGNQVVKPQAAFSNTGLNSANLAAGSYLAVLEGTFTVTTAGNVSISLAASANANTFTVIANAFLEIKRK